MKRMTYTALMKKIEDGRCEINAWSGDYADVTFYSADMNKRPTRAHVEVTKIPANVKD